MTRRNVAERDAALKLVQLNFGELLPGQRRSVVAEKLALNEIDALRADLADAEREIAELRRQIEGHCERIAKQSELLSRKAER
jgi:hypothetical protein